MAKKNKDLQKVFEQYKPMLKKFGDDLGEAAKKGEEGVIKMSKLLKLQLDVMGLSFQKEKIYHEIGKDVAKKLVKGEIEIAGLEKYKKRLEKLASEGEKAKKTISKVKSARARKKSAKKK